MVQYNIPNLLNHLQAYIKPMNPNYDILMADPEYFGWIDPSGLLSTTYEKDWKEAEMSLVPCRFYPGANLEGINAGMRYVIWTLLIELLTDAPVTAAQAQHWKDIFKQAYQQTLGETEGFTSLIKYYTDRVLNSIKDPYRPRLVANMNLAAEGMTIEAASRENHITVTTLETYTMIRRRSVSVRPLYDIGLSIYDIDIAPEVLTHPQIVKLENQALDLAWLVNDLYSYKKEFLADGAYHNYITIALVDPITGLCKNDRQGAIDYTCRKFCEILADFERGKKMLPSFGESEDIKVARYIGVMMDIVVGLIQFTPQIKRYGHCKTPEALGGGDVVFDMDPL